MKVAGDIVALSVPFAAGVAVSAALSLPAVCTQVSLLLSLTLMVACVRDGSRCTPFILSLFFCLGVFCHGTSVLLPPAAPGHVRRLAGAALERFTALLDSVPWGNGDSGALVKALLSGQRSDLDRETIAIFRKSGASHILALSGLHLGIIYTLFTRLLFPLGNSRTARTVRISASVLGAGLFTLMTGASPSTVRAFLFILFRELARSDPGRSVHPLSVFCLALTVQLVMEPQVITSAGFQLSYLAMLGIFTLYPQLESWYPKGWRLDPMRKIWAAAALSISCQLFTAPAAWWHFHTFPGHFLLTNLLALPLGEALIVCALAAVGLVVAGIYPQRLITATDKIAGALEFCLGVISSM